MFRLFIIDINRVMINSELSKNTVKSSESVKLYEQSQSQTHSQSQTLPQMDGHLNVRYLCSGVYYDTLSDNINSTTTSLTSPKSTQVNYEEKSDKKDYKDKIFECSNFIKTLKNDTTYKKVINDIKMSRK